VFLYHSEFYSEWVHARSAVRRVLRRYMAAVERQVFALSARIVAVSEFSARQIRSRLPEATERVRVVPTGVETDFFSPPLLKAELRGELNLPAAESVVLGVGRLAGVKQFDRLVTAFAVGVARGMDARLVIAGEGPERANLERLVATYGVQDRVRLAGYCNREQLRAYMQAADLQVCASAFENLSLAILEGMACGLPAIASDYPGVRAVVEEGQTGLLVSQGDPGAVRSGGDSGAVRLSAPPLYTRFADAQRLATLLREEL